MRDFWDARAREDAYFFIDDRRSYGDPDLAQFWSDGERDLDQILAMVSEQVRPADVVLDLGCGVGRLTRALAERAAQVYGLDISRQMLDLARRHNTHLQNVRWILSDGVSLAPLPDSSVDACVSHVVFQHIPDPSITLGYVREIGRVLRAGGWAAFQVSNDPKVHRPRRVAELRDRLTVRPAHRPRGRSHPAWLGTSVELAELRRAASEGGLALERVVGEGTQFCIVLARRTARRPQD